MSLMNGRAETGAGLKRALTVIAATILAAACGPLEGELDDEAEEAAAIASAPPFYGDPANDAVFAIDISHWEGPISQREMDCFWDSGVRHVVAGTQVEEVTRQQLSMAVARGMTVDAYVYLYWNQDIAAQVDTAFARASGFPIGRMWLDVEENPGGAAITEMVQRALDRCRATQRAICGIYTGPGFWRTYLNNTSRFADAPLWYAWYNYETSLDRWSVERFGGWAEPAAKQWAEEALCSVGVDKNSMQIATAPLRLIDRTLPPDNGLPPPAPSDLYPGDGSRVGIDVVKLMTATIPRVTRYELALERWTGTRFVSYYTWTSADGFRRTYPPRNSIYRFRARATNAHGTGPWSSYVTFEYGNYLGPRPGSSSPPPPAPAGGAPANLSPDGATITTPGVTLRFDPIAGAARYEVAIEHQTTSGAFATYTTYATTTPSKTFYPQYRGRNYRWRARAEGGPWSNWATLRVQ